MLNCAYGSVVVFRCLTDINSLVSQSPFPSRSLLPRPLLLPSALLLRETRGAKRGGRGSVRVVACWDQLVFDRFNWGFDARQGYGRSLSFLVH